MENRADPSIPGAVAVPEGGMYWWWWAARLDSGTPACVSQNHQIPDTVATSPCCCSVTSSYPQTWGWRLQHPRGWSILLANLATSQVSFLESCPGPLSASGRYQRRDTKKPVGHFRLCPLWLSKWEIKGKWCALFHGGAAGKVSRNEPGRTSHFSHLLAHLWSGFKNHRGGADMSSALLLQLHRIWKRGG